jgi:UDP-N-acetylglucosamine 4-epimerase
MSSHDVNVTGFINILISAKSNNIKRIVYASSSAVYGDNNDNYKQEQNHGNLLSPYATTKYIDEQYANIFTRCFDMECIGLRYFNVYGPNQNPMGAYAAVIPKFITSINTDKKIIINGDGTMCRDFVYVSDVVQANICALLTTNEKCYGNVYNIGVSSTTTINELYKKIHNLFFDNLSKNIGMAIYGPKRKGDPQYSCANIDTVFKDLKWSPQMSLDKGLLETIKWYCQ